MGAIGENSLVEEQEKKKKVKDKRKKNTAFILEIRASWVKKRDNVIYRLKCSTIKRDKK